MFLFINTGKQTENLLYSLNSVGIEKELVYQEGVYIRRGAARSRSNTGTTQGVLRSGHSQDRTDTEWRLKLKTALNIDQKNQTLGVHKQQDCDKSFHMQIESTII